MSARPAPARSGWTSPISLQMVPTTCSESFRGMPEGWTGLPLAPHPGAFGVTRKNHVHEGIDLYCPEGTPVVAMEPGEVVAVLAFTGPSATPPSPWWLDTQAVLVEGASGVVVYGEITPAPGVAVGVRLERGAALGKVTRVLAKDKGRPMDMLHLELHAPGTRDVHEWSLGQSRPGSMRDPTPMLMEAASRAWRAPSSPAFIKAGQSLIPIALVEEIGMEEVENDVVRVRWGGGQTAHARGFDAVEAVMLTRASALEGRRLRWRKGAWALHNLVAHPLMQLLAWMGYGRLAMRLHDATTPVPRG